MTSAVVDPSVLVSAFIGGPEGSPRRLIAAWRASRFEMIVSPILLDELRTVLQRPKFDRWAGDGAGDAYVDALAAGSNRQPDATPTEATVRDPNDEYLVALARYSNADALVSVDLDLLEAPLTDVTVVTPATFLTMLASTQ